MVSKKDPRDTDSLMGETGITTQADSLSFQHHRGRRGNTAEAGTAEEPALIWGLEKGLSEQVRCELGWRMKVKSGVGVFQEARGMYKSPGRRKQCHI